MKGRGHLRKELDQGLYGPNRDVRARQFGRILPHTIEISLLFVLF